MAANDYHLCAECGNKAYYDATITDERYYKAHDEDRVKVLCENCGKTHKLIVIPKGSTE